LGTLVLADLVRAVALGMLALSRSLTVTVEGAELRVAVVR
jgi:hypothetical protein